MYPLLKRLWQQLKLGSHPAAATVAQTELSVRWRCINAELGLAAWVAEPADRLALPRQPRGAKLLLAPEGGDGPALARLRQLAALHPDCLIVLPRWQNERLAAAGVPAEVALHLVLLRLRDDGWVGAATPMLLASAACLALAERYAQRYRALTQSLPGATTQALERPLATDQRFAWI